MQTFCRRALSRPVRLHVKASISLGQVEWVPAASTRVRCAQPSLLLTQPHTDAQGNMRMGSLAFRSLSLTLSLPLSLQRAEDALTLAAGFSPCNPLQLSPLSVTLFFAELNCMRSHHLLFFVCLLFVFLFFLLFLNWFLWLSPLSELINVSLLVQPLVAVLLGGSEFIYLYILFCYIYLFKQKKRTSRLL